MKRVFLSIFLIAAMLLPLCLSALAAEDAAEPSQEPAAETRAAAVISDGSAEPGIEDAAEFSPALDGSYKDEEARIAASIITSGMSDYDKLYAITKYAADNFSYGSYSSNGTAESLFRYGAGNCYANSYFIIDLCTLVGIKCWLRSAGRDPHASSTHVDAVALINGVYYTAGAGFSGTKPRQFSVCELPGAFSVEKGVLYQYDGIDTPDLVVPARSGDAYYHNRSRAYTIDGQTITQIGYSGEECFSYGGEGLRSITLPYTVTKVTGTAFKGCNDLENIYVDAANPYFTSIDGVLYSKDLTRLVCVPAKKTSVTIPNTVKTQDKDAFYGGTIPVTVSAGNTPFTDIDGQWFTESVRFVYNHSLFMGTSDTLFSPNSSMTRGMFITVLGRFAGGGRWSALDAWTGTLGISGAGQVAVRDRTTTSGSSVLTRIGTSGELMQVISSVPAGEDGAPWYEVQYGSVRGYVRQKGLGDSGSTLLRAYTGSFTDLPAGAYYTGHAQWANMFGVMYGVSDTAFCPGQNITREDICVLMYRYLTAYLGKSVSSGGSAFSDDTDISPYARDAVYAMRTIGVVNGYPDNTFHPRNYATRAEVAVMFESLYKYLNT